MVFKKVLQSFPIIILFVLVFISQIIPQTARESFAYPTGSFLDSVGSAGNGWGGPWKIDTTNAKFDSMCVVADTGFDYSSLDYDYPHIGNNATLSLPGGWSKSARYKRPFASVWPDVNGQYWISYLFDTKGDPSGDGGNSYFLLKLYSSTEYSSSSELVALGKGGGALNYSCGSGWPGSATAVDESNVINQGGPVWLVAMINMTGDKTADASARIFMWINPDPSTEPDTNVADVKNHINLINGIGAVGIECGGQDTIQLSYDEIRLGTSFLDVSSSLVTPGHLVFDSFKYSLGSNLTGLGDAEDGWADAWHLDPGATVVDSMFNVSDTGIEYGDMNYDVPHVGNLILGNSDRPGNGDVRMERTLDKIWTPDSGTIYWFSAIMELQNDTNSSTWSGIKLCQDHTDAAVMYGKGYGQDVYTCGSGYHGSLDDPECSSVTWDVGPVWLVGEIFNMGLGNQSLYYMWITPDPATEPDTNAADAKSHAALIPGIRYIRAEYGGGIPYQAAFDEIRLGTTYSDVISDVAKQLFSRPTQFQLTQNYPNPFNPTTQIEYSIIKSGYTTLKVYNILGQEVKTLFAGYQNVGTYRYTFNATNLASGVYFYRLETGHNSLTKKMILLK